MAGQETPPGQATSPGGSQGRNVLTPPSSLPPVSRQGLLLTKPNQEPEAGTPLVWPLRGSLLEPRADWRGQKGQPRKTFRVV